MAQSDTSTTPAGDLVKSQANLATLNQLIAKYDQLYKTYLQQVEAEMSKRNKRNYPYNIKNPNEVKNTLTPATPFPSNGTEDTCFKSCVDTTDCVYALYSNSGCSIDCNPNKCLLYGANADGIVPVDELPTNLPTCPASGDTDAWCKTFNHPATNAIIPVLVLRTGGTDWRTLAMQMPKSMANAADAPLSVDLTTNVQTWGPDAQFSDVNYAAANEISLQFRFFAEYWLNAYDIMSGSAPVVAGQGPIGTFAFSKLSSTNASASFSTVEESGMWNGEGPNEYTCKNEPTRNATGNNGDYDNYCIFDKESDAQTYCSSDSRCKGYISNQAQDMFTITANPVSNPPANGGFHAILRPKEGSMSYVGTFGGLSMFWNSAEPSTGGTAAGLKTAAALAATTSESAKFNYNYSAFKKPAWTSNDNFNALSGQIPPQLAGMSIPSWQFLGVQDSAEACQRAATDDPSHVYTLAVYHNASYTGNSAFVRACYGHVAGAPTNTISSANENNVQTMTPPGGYTKLVGKSGIPILRKLYQLNQQIMALTESLKMSQSPSLSPSPSPTSKEGFTQKGDDADDNDGGLSRLTKQLEIDATKLNEKIQLQDKLEGDAQNAERLLLYSRIKFGVAVVLGLVLAYLAYKFLTADELSTTIQNELTTGNATSSTGLDDSNYDL